MNGHPKHLPADERRAATVEAMVDLAAERGLGHDESLRLVAFARDGLARILAEELGLEPGDGR